MPRVFEADSRVPRGPWCEVFRVLESIGNSLRQLSGAGEEHLPSLTESKHVPPCRHTIQYLHITDVTGIPPSTHLLAGVGGLQCRFI